MNNSLALLERQLPDNYEDLKKYILIGEEAIGTYRSHLKIAKTIKVSDDIYRARLYDAQTIAIHVLEALAKLGEMLDNLSGSTAGTTKILPKGITKKESHVAQQISSNADAVLKVIERARRIDDLPTKREVIKEILKGKRSGKVEMPQVQGKVRFLEGDFFDRIKDVGDNSVDLLLVDPPYGVMKDYKWDEVDLDFLDKWIDAVCPKLKQEYLGFIFCDSRRQYEFETIIKKYFEVKNKIAWVRRNMSMGRGVKDRFISAYETVFYFGNKNLNLPEQWGKERFDMKEYAVPQSNFSGQDKKLVATQKPYGLIKELVGVGSEPGQLVLDPFAGSGTTGVACAELGRGCILIENNSEYIGIIKDRIDVIQE